MLSQNCTVVWRRKQKDMSMTAPIVEKLKEGSQTGELEASVLFSQWNINCQYKDNPFQTNVAPVHFLL